MVLATPPIHGGIVGYPVAPVAAWTKMAKAASHKPMEVVLGWQLAGKVYSE
jgi:hypothetical protein